MSKHFTLTAFCGFAVALASFVAIAQVKTVYFSENLAINDADKIRSHIESKYTRLMEPLSLVGNHAFLLVPNSNETTESEQFVFDQYVTQMAQTEFGLSLVKRFVKRKPNNQLISSIGLKIFFDVALKNGSIDKETPMWMTDRTIHHELMGAFHSKDNLATVALNNFQFRGEGLYTFVHEVFHLLDGNSLTGFGDIDDFLAEYRAILAEAVFYREFNYPESALVSDWHDNMLSKSWLPFSNTVSVDTEKVLQATLDLLYPLDPEFTISKVHGIGNTRLETSARNTYDFIVNSLTKFGNDPSLPEQTILLEFSKKTSDLKRIGAENRNRRELIESFFKNDKNKGLLTIDKINNFLDKGFNVPGAGHGGPKPRNGGP